MFIQTSSAERNAIRIQKLARAEVRDTKAFLSNAQADLRCFTRNNWNTKEAAMRIALFEETLVRATAELAAANAAVKAIRRAAVAA